MSRPPARRGARLAAAAVLAVAAWAAWGTGTAAADPAVPTNYRTTGLELTPPVDGVRVRVVGGDAFLEVTARPGTTVDVPGYDGEPYLRIRRDGVVERNERSPATQLNRSLTGAGPLTAAADVDAPPRWRPTGEVGSVAWHDHRIHWMLDSPPVPSGEGLVQPWTVPLVVDGQAVEITGELRWTDDDWAAAALASVAGALAGAATVVLGRRGAPVWPVTAAAAALAVALSWSTLRASPPGAGASLLPVAVCLAALVLALLTPVRRRVWVPLASVALLAGWGLLRVTVLWRPVVPSTLPTWVERGGTAVVVGVAVATAAVVLRRDVAVADAAGPAADPGPTP